jgi:Ca2+-binding RTX toxin-like protein
MSGGFENKEQVGSSKDDELQGTGGRDELDGKSGNDCLSGFDGNDKLYGAEGNDTLSGGLGNDWLDGEAGSDKFYADGGKDTVLDYVNLNNRDVLYFADGGESGGWLGLGEDEDTLKLRVDGLVSPHSFVVVPQKNGVAYDLKAKDSQGRISEAPFATFQHFETVTVNGMKIDL